MKHSSAELKMMARNILSGRWGIVISFTILEILITLALSTILLPFSGSTNALGLVLYLVVSLIISMINGLFTAGSSYFFLNICRGREYSIANLFAAFRMHPDRFLIVSLILGLCGLVAQLPSFLFLFTEAAANIYTASMVSSLGTIAASLVAILLSLFFMASTWLMLDFPEMGAIQSMKISAKLMRGNKGRYFYLILSFLGWYMLGMLSCGLGYLWIMPYERMTITYFYTDILHQLDHADLTE